MIFCACPSCKKPLAAEDSVAGKYTTCLVCGSEVPVPIPLDFPLLPPAVVPPPPAPPVARDREATPTKFHGKRRSQAQ